MYCLLLHQTILHLERHHKFLWVAIPPSQTVPTIWDDSIDSGNIGGAGDLFKAFVDVDDSSATFVQFKFSITDYPTSNTQNSITFKY